MRTLNNLKICFLAGSLTHGGAERQLFYILQTLRQCGARPRLLSLTSGDFWESRIKALGVPVTCVGGSRGRVVRLLRILKELLRDRPTVFQSQHFFTNVYALAAGRILGVTEIGAMRNDGASETRANGGLAGWLDLRPRHIAANSRPAIAYARSRGIADHRLFLLPNVVDLENLGPRARPAGAAPLKVLAVGRLVKQKRFERFLTALAKLRNRTTQPFKGIIVGDGPLRAELECQAAGLRLSPDHLEFRGYCSEMAPIYQEADICVLTSDHEGAPNVLLEAMACGLPCVATRVGGVCDLVREGETGLLAQAGDEQGLFAALLRLVNDAQLRTLMGRQARMHVEQSYSLARLPGYLSGLYAWALSREPANRRTQPNQEPNSSRGQNTCR